MARPRELRGAPAADEHPPPAGVITRVAYGIAAISAVVVTTATAGTVLLWPPSLFGNLGPVFGAYLGALAGIAIAALMVAVWPIWLLLRSVARTSAVAIAGATIGATVAWAADPFSDFVGIYFGALVGIALAGLLVSVRLIWLRVRSF